MGQNSETTVPGRFPSGPFSAPDAPRSRNGVGWFAVAISLMAACPLAAVAARRALFEGWWAAVIS